jgi:hypothetical protein
MKIGKFYQFKEYGWYMYPSKEKAGYMAHAGGNFDSTKMAAAWLVKGLINRFNYQVFMVPPASIFVLLEHDETTFGNRVDGYGTMYKILTERGEVGWIYVEECRITNLQLIGD